MATYNFHSMIGQGGFGAVYEAEREEDGWPCAAKTLRSRATMRELRRFHREVRLQAKLEHSHIVPIVAMNLEDKPPWFVMPQAQENLREHLERAGAGEERLWIFEQVASGLEHAHANGVIHRDIKPENILIFEDDDPEGPALYAALADFGLGRFRDRDTTPLTPSDATIGTVAYAAPEQWGDAKHVDERSDIYSLGKVLYELLTGDLPYPDSSVSLDSVPRALAYIIQKARPENRYQTVGALLADLRHARESEADLETPVETADQMVQALLRRTTLGQSTLEPLARHLVTNLDDYQLLTRGIPRLPQAILRGLLRHHLGSFRRVMEAYDEEVSGALPFDYCDVVADFYESIFDLTRDRQIRALILRRLPQLGFEHNRWHVGQVFARLVAKTADPTLIMALRDHLAADQSAATWCAEYLRGHSIPIAIRRAVGLGALER